MGSRRACKGRIDPLLWHAEQTQKADGEGGANAAPGQDVKSGNHVDPSLRLALVVFGAVKTPNVWSATLLSEKSRVLSRIRELPFTPSASAADVR